MNKKKLYLLMLGIFLLAFLIRIVHLLLIKNNPLFLNLLLDAKEYDEWAKDILENDWLSRSHDFMSPAYPYFLSLIYLIFGHSIIIAALIQIVLGSINCVLIFLITLKIFNYSELNSSSVTPLHKNAVLIGTVAAVMAALYGISIFYEAMLLKVVLINFLNLLMILMLLYGIEKISFKYFLFAGMFLGLSLFLRPNIYLFVPFVLFWLWTLREQINFKRVIYYFIAFCAGFVIISSFFWARNYSINHELVLTSGHGGMNLYVGNNPYDLYRPWDFSPDTRYEHIAFVNEARRLTGKNLTTMEASKFWYDQSLKFMREQPLKEMSLLIKKFFIFWNAYEVPLNGQEFQSCKNYYPLLRFPFLTFGFIAPLAFLGIILLINKNKKVNLLLFYFLAYMAANVMFLIYSESRFPVVPVFFICASFSILWIITQVKEKNYVKFIIAAVSLAALFYLVNNKYYNIENHGIKAAQYNNFGVIYANGQQYNNAIKEFKKAIIADPVSAEFRNNLANTYLSTGLTDSAIIEYKKALQIKPDMYDIHLKLAQIYSDEKKYENALDEFDEVLHVDSASLEGINGVGIVFAKMKKYKTAEFWFKKALSIDPAYIPAQQNCKLIEKLISQKAQ